VVVVIGGKGAGDGGWAVVVFRAGVVEEVIIIGVIRGGPGCCEVLEVLMS
jgi:hypothetical protein